jgi:hypothetical protein
MAKKKIISALQQGHAGEAHHLQHLIDAVGGDADGGGDQDEARVQGGGGRLRAGAARGFVAQILRRHVERRLGRHAAGRRVAARGALTGEATLRRLVLIWPSIDTARSR